ncbi:MAG: DUF3810 domain-containing protein [Lachnospiraceae bacterium]|nr:DUF3810 domain-containing protein [Lachnospiraceae bacterium]
MKDLNDEKETKTRRKISPNLVRLIVSAALILSTLGLMYLFSVFPGWFFPWYREVSRALLTALSKVMSVLPFALWEFLIVLLTAAALVTLIAVIVKRRKFFMWLTTLLLIASLIFTVFTDVWGLCHYAPELHEELGLEIREYTKEELKKATVYYVDKAAELAKQVPRDENGLLDRSHFDEWLVTAGKSYEKLADEMPVFRGSDAPVKRSLLFWKALSYMGITGIFVDVTAESTVNPDAFVSSLPFTMCHEAAHRLTIAGEDEANFAAFLAASSSDDLIFRYSAYYSASIYVYNALYKADSGAALKLWTPEREQLRKDYDDAGNHYEQYEGKVQEVSDKLNDTYLKAYSEPSGVQSYGEAADYLIAWYLKETKKP